MVLPLSALIKLLLQMPANTKLPLLPLLQKQA
jgi:hypothetical protein